MPYFLVYFMRLIPTPYKTLHYVSDMIFKLVRAREVKLYPNHCDSRLFSDLGFHDHNFSSEVRKCDCERLTGRNLNVIVFQNNYHKETEMSSLFVKPVHSVSLFILPYNFICYIFFL